MSNIYINTNTDVITQICNIFPTCTTIIQLSELLHTIEQILDNIDNLDLEGYILIYYKVLIDAILNTATNDNEVTIYYTSTSDIDKEILLLRTLSRIDTEDIDIYNKILNTTTYGQLSFLYNQIVAYIKITKEIKLMEHLIFYYMLIGSMLNNIENLDGFRMCINSIEKKRYRINSKDILIKSVTLINYH